LQLGQITHPEKREKRTKKKPTQKRNCVMGLGRVIVQCSRNTTQQELSERSSVCWWPKTSSSSRNWNSLWIPFQCMIFSQILQRRRFHSNLWKKKKKKDGSMEREKETHVFCATQRAQCNPKLSPPQRESRKETRGEEGDTGSRVTRRRVTRGKRPLGRLLG
jgi:hypothetical protein